MSQFELDNKEATVSILFMYVGNLNFDQNFELEMYVGNSNFDQNFKLEMTLNKNFKLEITLDYFFELHIVPVRIR